MEELTSKQRAQLRGLANNIDTILIVGKDPKRRVPERAPAHQNTGV